MLYTDSKVNKNYSLEHRAYKLKNLMPNLPNFIFPLRNKILVPVAEVPSENFRF